MPKFAYLCIYAKYEYLNIWRTVDDRTLKIYRVVDY